MLLFGSVKWIFCNILFFIPCNAGFAILQFYVYQGIIHLARYIVSIKD